MNMATLLSLGNLVPVLSIGFYGFSYSALVIIILWMYPFISELSLLLSNKPNKFSFSVVYIVEQKLWRSPEEEYKEVYRSV